MGECWADRAQFMTSMLPFSADVWAYFRLLCGFYCVLHAM